MRPTVGPCLSSDIRGKLMQPHERKHGVRPSPEELQQLQDYNVQQQNIASAEEEPSTTVETPQSNDVTKTEESSGNPAGNF